MRRKKMGKVKEWSMEEHDEQLLMDHLIETHADTVHKAEEILDISPELVKHKALQLTLTRQYSISKAKEKAYENLLYKICAIIQPKHENAFIEVFRFLKKTRR
tara:strand:- start:233 stop:541 length:309 start_codon:yes stop_codon:yes gene_type:complete